MHIPKLRYFKSEKEKPYLPHLFSKNKLPAIGLQPLSRSRFSHNVLFGLFAITCALIKQRLLILVHDSIDLYTGTIFRLS